MRGYRIVSALLVAGASIVSVSAQERELREAARLDREGKCDEAESYYRRALASAEPSSALLNNVGNHYLICGQPAKARAYFEQLLRTNPEHSNANLQLARIATDQRDGRQAIEYLKRVEGSDPAISLLRAEAFYLSGRHSEAFTTLDAVEKSAGDDPRVLFSIGLTCARVGLYDRAAAAFSAVLRHHPGNFDALLNLGRAAARAEDYERAQGALETALKVRPDDVDALFELGRAHAARRESSRAVFLLAQARKRSPKRPDILLALARAAEDAEYYGDSALAFDEYLELQPGDDIARRDRGRVCGRTEERREEGLNELAWYIAKHPDDPRAHYDLAHLTWETAPQKALDELQEAVRLDPEFAGAHVSRAWLLHRLGRTAEAVAPLETAIRILPNSPRALDQLGLAYLTLDDPSKAELFLRRALAISPEDPQTLLHMGRALAALDRLDEAESYLDKFQRVRPALVRDLRTEAGMIELAGLPPAERRRRQIDRFRRMVDSRPDDPELQLHLAGLLLADGEIEEAMRQFRSLMNKNADSKTWETAGKSLLAVEQYGLAREFLKRAADETPSARLDLAVAVFHTEGEEQALWTVEQTPAENRTGDYFLVKALILDAAGRTEEAGQVLQEGLSLTTTRPEAARQGALLLVRRGRDAEALGLLGRAIEYAPDNADLMLTKATLLALISQDAASAGILDEIQARWPEWDRPYLVHGLLLERQGLLDKAKQKLKIAVTLDAGSVASQCALARLDDGADPPGQCECMKGLYEILIPGCRSAP